jgi:hypothetical protein
VSFPRCTFPFLVALAFSATARADVAFFENEVRPLLVRRCYECHSEQAGKRKGGLVLDSKAGWQTGGDAGPALVPGKPDKSLLIHSVRYEDERLQMPPKSKLPESEIAVLTKWIAMGAPDPRASGAKVAKASGWDVIKAREEWAYRPLQKVTLPEVQDRQWPRSAVDVWCWRVWRRKG